MDHEIFVAENNMLEMERSTVKLCWEREEKLEELKIQKNEFIPGQWNVGSVMLGGLGKDPEIEIDIDDSESLSQDAFQGMIRRTHSRAVSRNTSRNTLTPRGGSSLRQSQHSLLQSRGTYRTPSRASLTSRTETGKLTKQKETTQNKLEHIWNSLLMPENLRLDMAIKYSSDEYIPLLEDIEQIWYVMDEYHASVNTSRQYPEG
ncbi:uncharacterized protein LOC135154176 [Lytechinus pictus]|uniref:uncharacterized protein LOC135154176 n=1 Tax=Lytechinus pictus TaxID=7653 RepID=UPI0030BA2400